MFAFERFIGLKFGRALARANVNEAVVLDMNGGIGDGVEVGTTTNSNKGMKRDFHAAPVWIKHRGHRGT